MPDQSVTQTIDKVEELAGEGREVTIGEIVGAIGSRSYGPFLLLPPLIEFSPLGGIPGIPTVLAALIIFFAGQALLGFTHVWIPQFLSERRVSSQKIGGASAKIRPVGQWLDRWFHGRLPALTKEPFTRIAAAVSILFALAVPPLELFPFASSAPMAAIAMFGLALLVRDGLLMIFAIAIAAVAIAIGFGALSL